MTIWEIFSLGAMPYPGLTNMEVIQYTAAGNRLQKPTRCPEELHNLLEKCWNLEPSQRPSFEMMVDFFKNQVKMEEKVEILYVDVTSTLGLQNLSA